MVTIVWRRRLDLWLDALLYERGLSPQTVAAYRGDLVRLGEWLEGQKGKDLLAADPAAISAHLRFLHGREISPRSVRRAMAAMHGFYRDLVEAGERRDDPVENLEAPRLFRRLPKVLSEAEVERLLAAPDLAIPAGLRDRAMLELLYATGLRVSELVGLRLPQIDLEGGFLLAFGKGTKERVVPVGEEAERSLGRYLWELRPKLAKGRHDAVFVNLRGAPMTRQGFWKILKAVRPARRYRAADLAARAAAQLRYPPAGARGRPARRAGDARPLRHRDDRDLHPHPPGTPARRL